MYKIPSTKFADTCATIQENVVTALVGNNAAKFVVPAIP